MPKKPKQLLVKCPGCSTIFVRTKAGKEQCGVCGDGKERMFKEVKGKAKKNGLIGKFAGFKKAPARMVRLTPKNHGKASGRTAHKV
jgi:hypothetical protein